MGIEKSLDLQNLFYTHSKLTSYSPFRCTSSKTDPQDFVIVSQIEDEIVTLLNDKLDTKSVPYASEKSRKGSTQSTGLRNRPSL